jgi:FkbM family methyltransferase
MSQAIPADPVFERLIPALAAVTDRRPVVVEIGVHTGSSTHLLLAGCKVPPVYFGFEPDPRNIAVLQEVGLDVAPFAVSDKWGTAEFHLSNGKDVQGRTHTASSSLQNPAIHLVVHPWCTFDQTIRVRTVPLDEVVTTEVVDVIWCDVQGAQRQVIAGAQQVLSRTRLLYIEVHPEPMYEGEPTFDELMELLPGWRVVERYESDVLLERAD